MLHARYGSLAIFTLLATLLPVAGYPATPRILLEKSASYALDDQVRAFRVPTINSSGKVKYYDVTIQLGVDQNGKLLPTAAVTANASPKVKTGVIQPGTYKANDGTVCDVTNMTLANGRVQSFFRCTGVAINAKYFELSAATGLVSDGHPYLGVLHDGGADKLTDVDTYTWGTVTTGNFIVDHCESSQQFYLIGAKTDGNLLILSVFGEGSTTVPANFSCTITFTKQA